MFKKIPLHTWIFVAMFLGLASGTLLRESGLSQEQVSRVIYWVSPIGTIFLRMIYMMIIPLVVSALTLGVASFGDVQKLGRIGFRMFKYTLVVTGISVVIGVGAVMLVQPGHSLKPEDRQTLIDSYRKESADIARDAKASQGKSFLDIITTIVPQNPLEDMVRAYDPSYKGGGLLAVMFFSLVMGLAMAAAEPEKVKGFKSALEGLYDITMRVINYAMKLAPLGIFALLFVASAKMGWGILQVLLEYVLLVMGALLLHLLVTYSIILRFFSGMSPAFFFRNVRDVMITAFSTSSSNASLPAAIKAATENLKLPKDISHFVLTIGSTGNQNGTALYEGITILFLAQCFNVPLSVTQQILVVVISVLAGMGTAGVPGGSLPVIMVILTSIGVPGESVALIYGVDRILDMSRTVLNVTGDVTAAAYISHAEAKRAMRDAAKNASGG